MSASEPISFRLSPQFAEQLQTEGAQRGMSRGDLARQLVIDGLVSRVPGQVSAELSELPSIVHSLEMDLTQLKQQMDSNHGDVKRWLTRILQSEPKELSQAIKELNAQVIKLREDFATGLVVLLTHVGGWNAEDAVSWVQSKLLNHK